MRRRFAWYTCKIYPVFKGSYHCLIMCWSWALCTYRIMNYLIRHFLLRVVSAVFQTSRSEARQQRTSRKLSLLGSCPHNLPSSVKIFIIFETHGNSEMFAMTLLLTIQAIKCKIILKTYLFPFFIIWSLIRREDFADSEGSTVTGKMQAVLAMNFF